MVVFDRAKNKINQIASGAINGLRVVTVSRNVKPVLPEDKLFYSAFQAVLIYKVVSGLGKLALIWATVVLLGGFVSLIKPLDLWIVASIVFVEAASILSTAEDPEEGFFIRAPEVMESIKETPTKFALCYRFFFADIFPTALMLTQLFAVTTSTALSLWRLIKQDYVNQQKPCIQVDCKGDQENVKASLNIFYIFVVVQGIVFFTLLASPASKQVRSICSKYELVGKQGLELLQRYRLDNHMKCAAGNVRAAFNNDLVAYAMQLVISDATEDQHLGVWTLDRILKNSPNKGYFLRKLRVSGDAIGRIIFLLGSRHKKDSPGEEEDVDTKACVARVLLELAPYLLVECFPGMMQQVSSLLPIGRVVIVSAGDHESRASHEENFTWYGVQILEKLMDNADNCRHVAHSVTYLLSEVIHLTNCADEKILAASVSVLHKLACIVGEAGDLIRRSISKDVHILANITSVVEHRAGTPRLQADVVGMLACLALDKTCKKEICTSRRIIRTLATILVDAPEIHEAEISDRARLTEYAAKALVLLTTGSGRQSSSMANLLLEIKPECIKHFVSIIYQEGGEHRYLIAKVLSNLRVYSNGDRYAHHLKKIDNTLPEILKAIYLGVEELKSPEHHPENYTAHTSKLLESFVGLSVQICTLTGGAGQFADALKSVNLEAGAFVQKLKDILVLHKSPTTEFPEIRRITVKLIIWMRQADKSYIKQFVRRGMDEALQEVADTETKLESFELFHCGVGVCKHNKPISSLINRARDA